MSILWSDDCLNCLCNFPHSLKEHAQAVEQARKALQQELQDMECDVMSDGDESVVLQLTNDPCLSSWWLEQVGDGLGWGWSGRS